MRPFTDFLAEYRRGACRDELTQKLQELVNEVTEICKAGTLTLTIKVMPAGAGNSSQIKISDDIKVKLPQSLREESIFFVDPDTGNITRDNPMQPHLPLREVERPNRTVAAKVVNEDD
jgi:hypothetical protein